MEREHMGDPLVEASALLWSVTAMSEATARLPQAGTWNGAWAHAAVGEAVWWVTLVDATLVRHHPEAYDAWGRFHRGGRRGRWADTRPTRLSWQAVPSRRFSQRAATFLTLAAAKAGSLAETRPSQ